MLETTKTILGFYPTLNPTAPLSLSQSQALQKAAQADAVGTYRSCILSIVSALTHLEEGYRSWPLVQLYYASFYAIKTILFSNGICIYYCEKKPARLDARVGSLPTKLTFQGAGSSHIAAGRIFGVAFPLNPLNGQVDLKDAFSWMREAREAANYNETMMNQDDHLGYFSKVDSLGLRKTLAIYNSNLPIYAFQKDDASIAFPLLAATLAKSSLHNTCGTVAKPLVLELLLRLKDKKGKLNANYLSP